MKTRQDFIDSILKDRIFTSTLENLNEAEKLHVIEQATALAESVADCFYPLINNINDETLVLLKKELKNKK